MDISLDTMGVIIKYLIPLPLVITQILLGLFVLAQKNKNEINLSFAFFTISVAFWNYCVFMVLDRVGLDVTIWDKFILVWSTCIPAFFLYFSFVFPEKLSGKVSDEVMEKIENAVRYCLGL